MKQKVVNYLKYNRVIYTLYYHIVSVAINILKLFIKPDDRLILFNSFAGRKYDDSTKAIFETMKRDPRFKEFKLVWAFHEPEKFSVDGASKIRTDCFSYFVTALKARVWVTNSSVERGLNFKGKRTLYFNTWHGSPIKKMGSDIAENNQSFRSKKKKSSVDIMNTQSYFEADIFSRCFNIPRNQFLEVGLPRNDELARYTEEKRQELRKELGIKVNQIVILYCPTFREYAKDENYSVVLTPPIDLDKWEKKLGENYVFLFRAHYEVSRVMDIKDNGFIRNVTNYPYLNDLMIASDYLISDYSSIFFDYSIMDKIMLHFTYDYDEYSNKRGVYFDIRKCLSGADNEDDLLERIINIDANEEIAKTYSFREKYMNFYGDASKSTVDCIASRIFEGE